MAPSRARDQVLGRVALLGDVAAIQHEAADGGVERRLVAVHAMVRHSAVAMAHPGLEGDRLGAGVGEPGQVPDHLRRIVRVDKVTQRAAFEVRWQVAEHPLRRWRDVHDGQVGLGHDDDVPRIVDERAEAG